MSKTICPNFEDHYDEEQYLELEEGLLGTDVEYMLYYCKYCNKYALIWWEKGKMHRKCFDTKEEAENFIYYEIFGEEI